MMISTRSLWWAAAAVLLFWAVGGYNRLVRMRNAIQQHYVALDARLMQRNDSVAALIAALPARVEPSLVETLQAALGHSRAAREQARRTPCDAVAITNLGVTETVLADVQARVARVLTGVGDALADSTLPTLVEQVAQAEAALAYTRDDFNRAARAYNHAVRQFPTRLLAAVFGFAAGATLPALAGTLARPAA
ncbi:MAG: LemA family protein [Burkholderiaceae bacterium]